MRIKYLSCIDSDSYTWANQYVLCLPLHGWKDFDNTVFMPTRHVPQGYLNLFELHPWVSVMESQHMLCKLPAQENTKPVWMRAKHEDLFASEALTWESVSWESPMYNSLRMRLDKHFSDFQCIASSSPWEPTAHVLRTRRIICLTRPVFGLGLLLPIRLCQWTLRWLPDLDQRSRTQCHLWPLGSSYSSTPYRLQGPLWRKFNSLLRPQRGSS